MMLFILILTASLLGAGISEVLSNYAKSNS